MEILEPDYSRLQRRFDQLVDILCLDWYLGNNKHKIIIGIAVVGVVVLNYLQSPENT